MRKIKFRGADVENNEYVYGNGIVEGLGAACSYVQKLYLVKNYGEGDGKS